MTRAKLNYTLAVIAWAMAVACVLAYQFVWLPAHHEIPEPEPVPVVEDVPVIAVIQADDEEDNPLYHLKAIEFYPVPLDHDLQAFIIRTCEELSIDPAIIMAMIDQESDFRADVIGDDGASVGLMQIQERWHRERMERLGAFDLTNPYQNAAVGIDFMAELLNKYPLEEALTAYNSGSPGHSKYSEEVLAQVEVYRLG